MQGFTFYKSYWETAQAIPDPGQRLAFLEACIAYTLEDTEPEELPAFANLAFTAVRKQLDKSKAKGSNAKKQDKTESNEIKQNQTKTNKNKTHTDTVTDTVTDTENNNNVRQAAPATDAQLSEEFEKLWKMYPKDRRMGKKKAAAAYKRVRTRQKNPVAYTDVLLGINRYNAHISAHRIESRYVLQGETFFCNERWLDEYGSGAAAPVGKWEQGATRNDYTDDEFNELERIAGAG